MAEVVEELHGKIVEAAEGNGQRAQLGRHVLEFSPLEEGLEADVGDQVVAVLASLGDQTGEKGRAQALVAGGSADHLHRAERREAQGDHFAGGGLLYASPLLGRFVETVAEAVGDPHGFPGIPPMIAAATQEGGGLQGVVFFRP